jgi:hypothetical protein
MARKSHHSSNWGGKREGSGRKLGGRNRMTQKALDMVAESDIHPLQYLLSVVSDKEAPRKDRLNAAQAVLPYCLTRLATTEINVNHSLSEESEEALVNRLMAAQNQLIRLGVSVIDSKAVNE